MTDDYLDALKKVLKRKSDETNKLNTKIAIAWKTQGEALKIEIILPAIRLPDGWRIPWRWYSDEHRVREKYTIWFYDRETQELTKEWEDNDSDLASPELMNRLRSARTSDPRIIRTWLGTQGYADADVEYTEQVLSMVEGQLEPQQRSVIRQGIHRYQVLTREAQSRAISIDPVELPELQHEIKPISTYASGSWDLPPIRYAGGILTAEQTIAADDRFTHVCWKASACMLATTRFLTTLGYDGLGPHNLQLEYVYDGDSNLGSATSYPTGRPIISFDRDKNWDEDVSIILHELGHVFWALCYTRPPGNLKVAGKHGSAIIGAIQEGFSDYFAATVIVNSNGFEFPNAVSIGGDIPRTKKNADLRSVSLPRSVTDEPFELATATSHLDDASIIENSDFWQGTELKVHLIGNCWSHLLWDFARQARQQLSKDKIDRIVLQAHIQPVASANQIDIFPSYFQSLKETAEYLTKKISTPLIIDWDLLAQRHRIPWTST
jgi:hypothetical protein